MQIRAKMVNIPAYEWDECDWPEEGQVYLVNWLKKVEGKDNFYYSIILSNNNIYNNIKDNIFDSFLIVKDWIKTRRSCFFGKLY